MRKGESNAGAFLPTPVTPRSVSTTNLRKDRGLEGRQEQALRLPNPAQFPRLVRLFPRQQPQRLDCRKPSTHGKIMSLGKNEIFCPGRGYHPCSTDNFQEIGVGFISFISILPRHYGEGIFDISLESKKRYLD